MDRSPAVVEPYLSVQAEMAAGPLGDARLNARRDRVIEALARHPDRSFPEACGGDSEAEAFYRFLRNRRVSLETVIAPHFAATRERCGALGEVLVIHDTTEMSFAGEQRRVGLSRQSQRRQGFWVHAALAVSAEGLRAPVGLLAVHPFVRTPPVPGTPPPSQRTRFLDPAKESRRWAEGVATVRARLGAGVTALHLMDREGDSYELLATLIDQRDRFVVRLRHDRRVVAESEGVMKLSAAVPPTAHVIERQVVLSPRPGGDRSPAARHLHPPRPGRTATLRFTARRVVLQRPASLATPPPATLAVHVVYGWEIDVPAGETPVEWRLVTTEPIDTAEQESYGSWIATVSALANRGILQSLEDRVCVRSATTRKSRHAARRPGPARADCLATAAPSPSLAGSRRHLRGRRVYTPPPRGAPSLRRWCHASPAAHGHACAPSRRPTRGAPAAEWSTGMAGAHARDADAPRDGSRLGGGPTRRAM